MLGLLAVVFLQAVAADGAPPVSPDWAGKPKPANPVLQYYPAQARRMNVEGKAVLGCTVTAAGELTDCVVNSEDPEGMGFGDAALKLSKLFKMHPARTSDGSLTQSHINIPIRFQLPKK